MPTSRPNHLTFLCNKILELQPKSILDVGVGFGSKGMLFREYTDIWGGNYKKENWKTIINGIEIFKEYITPLQLEIYDTISYGNAIDVLKDIPVDTTTNIKTFDLIYCGDMIEHLTKEDGLKLIELMKQHAKRIIIVTPVVVSEQGAVFGNENEKHISQWSELDFPGAYIGYFGNVLYIEMEMK